jgi:hypothetical protein
MFAEAFYTQDSTGMFCQEAGGTLAVPSSAVEAAEIDQLLNSTLPNMAPWRHRDAIETDYAVWMGLKRTNGEWGTMAQAALGSYTNWAVGQPSKDKASVCSLFTWSWATRKALWSANVCAWRDMAHASVCGCHCLLLGQTYLSYKKV